MIQTQFVKRGRKYVWAHIYSRDSWRLESCSKGGVQGWREKGDMPKSKDWGMMHLAKATIDGIPIPVELFGEWCDDDNYAEVIVTPDWFLVRPAARVGTTDHRVRVEYVA